jgi:universal stress protein F
MNKILVGLDGSKRAPAVLDSAIHLATTTGAKLVLYRAITVSPDLPSDALAATEAQLESMLLDHARQSLTELAKTVPADRLADVVVAFATPWDGICRAAREHGADIIVIGSHGYGGLDRVLGTTAAKVVNHAECNVLVIRSAI